ncbi:FAD-dependent oxidoreductase [Chitinophaga lutea]
MRVLLFVLLAAICHTNAFASYQPPVNVDVVVYGGTSAGVAAAVQLSRMGKSVVLIEPTQRIGGLTTGGLGATDIGNKAAIGGIAREFYRNIRQYYDNPANWKWQTREDYVKNDKHERNDKHDKKEDAMWTFEPSAALKVYHDMLSREKVKLVYGERLNRETGVVKEKGAITSIRMENGTVYKGKMFIDATYEGDLMAAAGVSYTLGREANAQYKETLNGVQANRVNVTLEGKVSRNARYHNFVNGVDPYVVKGDKSSGLLPNINPGGPGIEGAADEKIQAYCFRMTLTDHPDNRIPFTKPANYNERNYELLFRNYEAAPNGVIEDMYDYGDPIVPWINTPMPNRKTDINNQKGFSTNFIGQNYRYPDGSYAEREKIVQAHREHQQGLMWTLANHPRIPEKVRKVVSQWGTCKDEYDSKSRGWQEQLYIREARRMVSDYVMTQYHCEGLTVVEDPVGLAAYTMDSHMVQRYVDANGYIQNEGNVAAPVGAPFPISYRSIIPKKSECGNLLVPVCLSASHIAFGSIRMEPVFMVLGQSAAIAASLAIDDKVSLQDLGYAKLQQSLIENKQLLERSKK